MFYFQRPLVALNNYGGLTTSRAPYVTVTNNCRSSRLTPPLQSPLGDTSPESEVIFMKYKLVIANKEYVLVETKRNTELIQQAHSGQYPKLCTIDTVRGPITANLSEHVSFIIEGDEFRRDAEKPKAVIMS